MIQNNNEKPRLIARCAECGSKGAITRQNVRNVFKASWRDYPSVKLTQDLELPRCGECGHISYYAHDAKSIDQAIEASIREQYTLFVEKIRKLSDVSVHELARILGVSQEHLANVGKPDQSVPPFTLWNTLRVIADEPSEMLRRFSAAG